MQKDEKALEQIGRAYWGFHWITPMGEALKLNEKTMRQMAAGTARIPDGVWAELLAIGIAREGGIIAIRQSLAEMLRPNEPPPITGTALGQSQVGEMRRPPPRGGG